MKYIIELELSDHWERSWAYPDEYTRDEAKELINDPCNESYSFRIVPLIPKPYRRHAAVTWLELRGAKAMLESAIAHGFNNSFNNGNFTFDTYSILIDAKIAVIRQLGKL